MRPTTYDDGTFFEDSSDPSKCGRQPEEIPTFRTFEGLCDSAYICCTCLAEQKIACSVSIWCDNDGRWMCTQCEARNPEAPPAHPRSLFRVMLTGGSPDPSQGDGSESGLNEVSDASDDARLNAWQDIESTMEGDLDPINDVLRCQQLTDATSLGLLSSVDSRFEMSDLEHVPWSQEEWNTRFCGRRRYPRSEGQERSLLGKGGFASVYRVRIAGQTFAAKVLDTEDLGFDQAQTAEIQREAKMLQKLKHKHVIQYVSYFHHDDIYIYLILEYAAGGSLQDHLAEDMSADLQQRLMRELANGLLYIHEQHVIHRDLKASNILLAGNELSVMRVKISDFGLSCQFSSTLCSKRASKSGSPCYFSPERGLEKQYDYSADMWAVGCIFLELLHKENLKESLWPEHKKDLLLQKLDSATRMNPLLGEQASKLLQHDMRRRIRAFDLYTALQQAPLLTEQERLTFKHYAATGHAVSEAKFYDCTEELVLGQPVAAALGLKDRLQVADIMIRVHLGMEAIQHEVDALVGLGQDPNQEVRSWLNYICNETTSEKQFVNGIRDQGRPGKVLNHFLEHPNAKKAQLTDAHVVALRLYTTHAFKHINDPLRDKQRFADGRACPLPVITYLADEAIRKLRAVNSEMPPKATVELWRGMQNRHLSKDFGQYGGTELAFLSTTSTE